MQNKNVIYSLIHRFQNNFETCSKISLQGDGYQFYVFYQKALNTLIRIIYLCENKNGHNALPGHFLIRYSYPLNLEIEKLGTMDITKANTHKRKLLNLFMKYLPKAIKKFHLSLEQNIIIHFLENIYYRDLFWNFRDIANFNKNIKKEIIFRSSALCLIADKTLLARDLMRLNIRSIIDLRSDVERNYYDYDSALKLKFNIVYAPLDPWHQNVAFNHTRNIDHDAEIAYLFFITKCKSSIKKIMETIINFSGASIIHCHAGKDRTGVVITLFHLISGAPYSIIALDYLASKMGTSPALLRIILDEVKKVGGIESYLTSCHLNENQIRRLKNKLRANSKCQYQN